MASSEHKVPEIIHGSCLCGSVRYELRGGLGMANLCYCSSCRKVTGTFFETNSAVEEKHHPLPPSPKYLRTFLYRQELSYIIPNPISQNISYDTSSPTLKTYNDTADSGVPVLRSFCSNCGSPMFMHNPKHAPGVVIVATGTMEGDVERWWRPQTEYYCKRKPGWMTVDGLEDGARKETM
ncbi:MAG: hypothetical protein L6R39_001556 [Caloplaca ligustica]|nr:MAG: hypothetical protein L6R39_001556 [Caloplaca ligustica]